MIDLRSDLLSQPTPAIAAAIQAAMTRPAAFGLREDAAQRDLEALAAELLGQEDALLFPTCSMANQTALALLTRPGSCVVTPSDPHILTSEAGGPAVLSGLTVQPLPGGEPALADWAEALGRAADELRMPVSAVLLENTHNRSGGRPLDAAYTEAVLSHARGQGIGAHLDGARLPNAAVATGRRWADLAGPFDTVSLSLNKGLCAPMGAVLAGSRALIRQAVVVRQRLGGGIRPTAILAAAGLTALQDTTPVAHDHERARRLAGKIGAGKIGTAPGMTVDVPPTNIVLLRLYGDADAFCRRLESRGVLALPFGPGTVRFVTYHGLDDEDVDRAAGIVAELAADLAGG